MPTATRSRASCGRADRGAGRGGQPVGRIAVRATLLPGSGRRHLAGRERLARRTQALQLTECFDERASAGTVEPVGFELGERSSQLPDRIVEDFEHRTSRSRGTIEPGEAVVSVHKHVFECKG